MLFGPLIIESPLHGIHTLLFKYQSAYHRMYSQKQSMKQAIPLWPMSCPTTMG